MYENPRGATAPAADAHDPIVTQCNNAFNFFGGGGQANEWGVGMAAASFIVKVNPAIKLITTANKLINIRCLLQLRNER